MVVGQSFAPTQAPSQMSGPNQAQNPNGQSAVSPVMDAIKILSFRVPSVVGAASAVPQALLAGTGGAGPSGADNAAMTLQWLQRFFGQGLAQQPTAPNTYAAGPVGGGNPFAQAPPSASAPGMPNATGAAPFHPAVIVQQKNLPTQSLTWGDVGGATPTHGPAMVPRSLANSNVPTQNGFGSGEATNFGGGLTSLGSPFGQ